MTLMEFILCGFATFRLSLMVSKEDGPAWLFRKLRRLPPPKSSAREGLQCQWCMSAWAALLVVLGYISGEGWIIIAINVFAASGAAICLNQAFTKTS